MANLFYYLAGALTIIWGIAHFFPTKNVVKGFGEISEDNKRIITMEWIIEGAALIFIGILTIFITLSGINPENLKSIYWLIISMLLILAVISLFTGFQINFLPFKLCPLIFTVSAILIIMGILSNRQESVEVNNSANKTAVEKEVKIKKATGIGGIFFKAEKPEELKLWYNKNLGLETNEYGSMFEFRLSDSPEVTGYLQWSPFSSKTTYFEPSKKEFMINYRVKNLDQLVEELKKSGVNILDTIETYEYGKFIHILDPENNKVELWEPVDPVFQK